ncbi:universal stress protein [Pseudarthrobacter sp. AB1]|uniref:universal stress protein n=1 Tax=Pseudarthrobacter sp. AB1 TaxID=2138309 RepID=UPI00186BA729|nr:universal stress protein [Pseudarthrobacter sp. AB1]MBE4720054.1 universal stress protein [Pseudarthrobacter sp. AB1]
MQESKNIVVGYDGSVESGQAVRWAARQAVLRSCGLHLVHCSLWPLLTHDLGPVPGVADSGLERSGEIALDEGLALAKDEAPALDIKTSLLYGWAPEHLLKLSVGEVMLVVGSRGIGGFMGLLVGSVSLEMAATASCPVAVIRAGGHPEGPVVVAVDSSGSPAALKDACALASLTGAKLTIVHVQHAPAGFKLLRDPAEDSHPSTQELLDSVLHSARETTPGISIEGQLLTDASVPRAILEAARGASITVVGTKGHGLIRGTIGSTAHAVLHHAKGPVLISRRRATPEDGEENRNPSLFNRPMVDGRSKVPDVRA